MPHAHKVIKKIETTSGHNSNVTMSEFLGRDSMWATPLMTVVMDRAPLRELHHLIDSGHDPDEIYHNGATVLHVLVSTAGVPPTPLGSIANDLRYFTAALQLIFTKVKVVNPRNDFGQTPIELGMSLDVPVEFMSQFVCMWSRKMNCSAVWLYFNEASPSNFCPKYLSAIVSRGGSIYPEHYFKNDCRNINLITFRIIKRLLKTKYENSAELLKILLRSGFDLATIEQADDGLATFVNATLTFSKSDRISKLIHYMIACGGNQMLASVYQWYLRKENRPNRTLETGESGNQKTRHAMYKKLVSIIQRPASLQNLAARTVRLSLSPNARVGIAGLKHIPLSQGYYTEMPSMLKDAIVLAY